MADTQSLTLNFKAKIKSFQKLNDEFTLCKCYVQALGKNRNLTHFYKDNVLRNLDSMNYIPVIGHLIEDSDGKRYMGGHDAAIEITDKGIEIKNLTVPFGVVPYQEEHEFEDVTEPNGDVVPYLMTDIILWTGRYPELLDCIYDENIYFNQSMEILVSKMEPLKEDKNYMDIIDFSYSALCLLGKSDDMEYNVKPCFPSSKVEPYQFNLNKDEFTQLMKEMKYSFDLYNQSMTKSEEGGSKILEQKVIDEILAKHEFSVEQLDFEITEDMTKEDFEAKVQKFAEKFAYNKLFATYREKNEALWAAIQSKNIGDAYYWLHDFDDQYAYVNKEAYENNAYITSHARIPYEIKDGTCSLVGDFEEMYVSWLTAEEKQRIDNERNDYESRIANLEKELDELRQFKIDTQAEEHKAAVDAVMEEFADLQNNEEFKALQEKCYTYDSLDELRIHCYAIRGKAVSVQFSANKGKNNTITVPVKPTAEKQKTGRYGNLFD